MSGITSIIINTSLLFILVIFMVSKMFEGEERIADLSKGWQQFALGVLLFYIVLIFIAANLIFFFLGSALSGTTGTSSTLTSATPGPSSLLMFAYGFGGVFFVIKFIKRYNMSSVSDLGFGLSIIAGILLLIGFLTVYEFTPIIQGALGGKTTETAFGTITSKPKTNIVKTTGSLVFYLIAGIGLALLGKRFNKGSTPLIGVFTLLIVPMLLMAAFFSLGSIVDTGISLVLHPEEKTTLLQPKPDYNLLIAQGAVALVFFVLVGILLFFILKNPDRRALYFQSIAFKIIAAGFLVSFLFGLIGFSSLLAIDFQNTEIMKILVLFGEWLVKVIFFGAMAFAMFYLCNRFKRMSQEAPKQQEERPKFPSQPVISP